MNLHINPPTIDGPRLADVCAQLDGCLNGDVFKFGTLIGWILIGTEIVFWLALIVLVKKRFSEKK